jgi:hypothetical protein
MIQETAPIYCSDLSRKAGEPLIGSATPTSRYLLIEYNGSWGEKALNESDIPTEVKNYLNQFTKSDKKTKALLIHRPAEDRLIDDRTDMHLPSKLHFFLASVTPSSQAIYTFEIESYEQILEMDLKGIFEQPEDHQAVYREEPLLLVCVNGRRDRCCALHGMPVFNALTEATSKSTTPVVWQCTHLGGHRFATNMLVLPHGLLYGRVDSNSAFEILRSARTNSVYLPNLRGRTAYMSAVQVADYFLRQQTGEMSLKAFEFIDAQEIGDSAWTVTFEQPDHGQSYRLKVLAEETSVEVYESCQLDKTTRLVRFAVSML